MGEHIHRTHSTQQYPQHYIKTNLISSIKYIMGNNQSTSQSKQSTTDKPAPAATTTQSNSVPNVTALEPNVAATTPTTSNSQYSIKAFAECATQFLQQVGPWIHTKKAELSNNQVCASWNQATSSFESEVQSPLCKLYNTIPEKFTEAKFELISPYSYNQRFTILNILCAFTAIGTITLTSQINPFSRVLRTTRNAGFMYLLGGLVFAPEIYNPMIRKW